MMSEHMVKDPSKASRGAFARTARLGTPSNVFFADPTSESIFTKLKTFIFRLRHSSLISLFNTAWVLFVPKKRVESKNVVKVFSLSVSQKGLVNHKMGAKP